MILELNARTPALVNLPDTFKQVQRLPCSFFLVFFFIYSYFIEVAYSLFSVDKSSFAHGGCLMNVY